MSIWPANGEDWENYDDWPSLVLDVMQDFYGKGPMVDACCRHLVSMVRENKLGDDPERTMQLAIWNWFPGGDTALMCAQQVLEFVPIGPFSGGDR